MRRKLTCRHQMGGFQRGNSISFAQQNWSKKWLRHKHFFTAIVLHRNRFPSYWHSLPMWYNTGKQNADAHQATGLTSACIFRFLRREPRHYQRSSARPQLHLKNFISNRREQPAWAARRSSSTIPVFRNTKSSTSPGVSCLTSSPITKAKKVSGSSGNGWLSVKRNRRKER